jgi:hypothetical protein
VLLWTFVDKHLRYPFLIISNIYLRIKFLYHVLILCLTFWGTKNCYTVRCYTCVVLHFYQKYTGLPITLHPHQYLLFSAGGGLVVCFHISFIFKIFFFTTGVWIQGLTLVRQALYHLSHSTSPFCAGFFQDRVSHPICLDRLRTLILLISASWVARITKHEPPAPSSVFFFFK